MLRTSSKLAILAVISVGVSACSGDFYREAGAEVDEGGFGNPTMTNSLISTGELAAVEGLQRRFENEAPAAVTFAFNSARLDEGARQALMAQAAFIRSFPEVRFRVYGHTDLVGSDAYNKALGLRRANTVVAFLTQQGISRSRLEAVASFGETQPVVATQGRERRNRRTVTEVTGFMNGNGTVLDGKYAAVIYGEHIKSAERIVFDEVSAGVAN